MAAPAIRPARLPALTTARPPANSAPLPWPAVGDNPALAHKVREATMDSPASMEPRERPARRRPLIYVYELPVEYNVQLLQYRIEVGLAHCLCLAAGRRPHPASIPCAPRASCMHAASRRALRGQCVRGGRCCMRAAEEALRVAALAGRQRHGLQRVDLLDRAAAAGDAAGLATQVGVGGELSPYGYQPAHSKLPGQGGLA
jgi:hypothetical protein